MLFPGAAQVGGQGTGEQELGVRGHDEPGPAVCLPGIADLRGGEAEGAFEELEGVLDIGSGEVGVPELVQGQGAGAGVPEPHGAVRAAAVGQALDGDVDEGAGQDRQVRASGEPAAVAVDQGVHAVPGPGPDSSVERGIGEGEFLVRFRVRGQGFRPAPRPVAGGGSGEVRRLQAVHRSAAPGRAAVLALPGDGLGVEHAAGREPDQDVSRAAQEAVGEGGGTVAGVEDEQRRGVVAVPGGAQPAQHVLHLGDRLGRAGRGRGPRHVDERGPRGAQVPGCRGELVLPAGRGLAGALAMAGAVVHVLPARGAPRVRPGVGGRVDGEPQPGPPGARVPHPGGVVRGQPGQRLLQQPAIDDIMLRDPREGLRAIHQRRQHLREQGEQPLVIDPPGGQGIVERAVAAAELRLQAQLDQRGHRMIGAQDRIDQLEGGIRAGGQALIQPGAELPQRQVAGDRAGHLAGMGGGRRQQREPLPAGQRCENMVTQRLLP